MIRYLVSLLIFFLGLYDLLLILSIISFYISNNVGKRSGCEYVASDWSVASLKLITWGAAPDPGIFRFYFQK